MSSSVSGYRFSTASMKARPRPEVAPEISAVDIQILLSSSVCACQISLHLLSYGMPDSSSNTRITILFICKQIYRCAKQKMACSFEQAFLLFLSVLPGFRPGLFLFRFQNNDIFLRHNLIVGTLKRDIDTIPCRAVWALIYGVKAVVAEFPTPTEVCTYPRS